MAGPNLLSPTQAIATTSSPTIPVAAAGQPTSLVAASTTAEVKIEKAVVVNNDSAAHLVSIGVCPTASIGSIGAQNWVLNAFPLGAGESLPLGDYLEGAWLGAGDCLMGFVDSGTKVTIFVSITTFT